MTDPRLERQNAPSDPRLTAPPDRRPQAPPGRRRCEIVDNRASGGYRIFTALDRSGPEPRAGQFYMLAAAEGWGQRDGRPYLPRAFSVAGARPADDALRLDFLVEAVGPGTERLAGLRPGEGLWVTGPLGRPFSPPGRLVARPRRGDPGRRRHRDRAAGDLAPATGRAGRRGAHPARVSRSGALRGGGGAVRLLGGQAGERGRAHRPPRLRHRPARGLARGGRGAQRRRLCLRAAGHAGGGAGDVRGRAASPPSWRWRRRWPAASGHASGAPCRFQTAATCGSAWTARWSTRPGSRPPWCRGRGTDGQI